MLTYWGMFTAGILTFLSPCILPLIPVYFAILVPRNGDNDKSEGKGHLFIRTLFFSAGFILVFILLGLGATQIGRVLNEHRDVLYFVSGVVMIVFGFQMLKIWKLDFLNKIIKPDTSKITVRRGIGFSFLLGLAFAASWTPCAGPLIGGALTYTASKTTNPIMGGFYLLLYGSGIALPLLVFSVFVDTGKKLMSRLHPFLTKLERIAGLILVLVGINMFMNTGMFSNRIVDTAGYTLADTIKPAIGEKSEKVRFVEFYTDNCPICRKMAHVVEKIEKQCISQGVEVIKLNIDIPQNRKLSQKYGVSAVPTFVIFDKKGMVASYKVGFQDGNVMKKELTKIVQKECPELFFKKKQIPPKKTNCSTDKGC